MAATPSRMALKAPISSSSARSLTGLRSSMRGTPVMSGVMRVTPASIALVTKAVATPSKPPSARLAKRSKVEIIKEQSDFLRHPLMEELVSSAPNISEEAMQLMKFHGSYMQDQREKRSFGNGKFYQFMMRTRQPSGQVTNQLYLVMDELADKYGNGTLRLTTRETFQLHGVLKQDLKTVFSSVINAMGSTLGACGDVNRNVIGPPAPIKNDRIYKHAQDLSNDIADLLAPQSGAYYDVWLDGEKFMTHYMETPVVTKVRNDNSNGTNFEGSPEPIYGTQFMPRKFKVAVTVPGDNNVDILTNDVGVVVVPDATGRNIKGYDVYVGGGMGRTHRAEETFPRLASPLGFCETHEDVLSLVKAIACVQRDYGRRDDRKQARLKYLVHSWGMDKFRKVTEQYYGKQVLPFYPLPDWKFVAYHGWFEQGDGKLFYGIPVMNGRIKGEGKKALRKVIERYELPVAITAQQDLILCEIDPTWKNDIMSTLQAAGVLDVSQQDPMQANSMACPALPLCGLAVTEAERGLPDVIKRLRDLLNKVGLKDESFLVRMTGCPNGCARPYMAELGFVGDGPNTYQIYLGGSPKLDRLAECFADKVHIGKLEEVFEPIFYFFKTRREASESFGDFVHRVGFEVIRQYQAVYVAPPTLQVKPRVMIEPETFNKLVKAAEQRGTTLSELASELIDKGLA